MNAQLIHRADVRQLALREDEAAPAIDLLGRLYGDNVLIARVRRWREAQSQPIGLGLLILLGINPPWVSAFVASPADVDDADDVRVARLTKMHFGRHDHRRVHQLAQPKHHVWPPDVW